MTLFIISAFTLCGAFGWRAPSNYTDIELVTTELNRKFFYPRCLLFDSCDVSVRAAAVKVGSVERSVALATQSLPRNATLETRMQGHPFIGLTLNVSLIYSTLLSLEPTHPRLFTVVSNEDKVSVVYMCQGPKRSDVPDWYSQMTDLIFLSYHEKDERYSSLFFPHSTFEQGRLSLYVTARILELQQGWLYNFFVFLDDDVGLRRGTLAAFEADLKIWQPAVAGPLFPTHTSLIAKVTSVDHFDHLFIAYHREVVEVLFPKETKNNLHCWYISDYLQILEQTVSFRNHLLLLPSMWIKDQKHREYPSNKCTFDKHRVTFQNALPANLRGCVPPYMRAQPAYSAAGEPRKKARQYFDFQHLLERTTPGCSCWSPESVDCCTVDPDGAVPPSTAACREIKRLPAPDGALLQCASERSVWLIGNNSRQLIFSAAVFARLRLNFSDVQRIKVEECNERLYWMPERDLLLD